MAPWQLPTYSRFSSDLFSEIFLLNQQLVKKSENSVLILGFDGHISLVLLMTGQVGAHLLRQETVGLSILGEIKTVPGL